jgi:hypothetical protein
LHWSTIVVFSVILAAFMGTGIAVASVASASAASRCNSGQFCLYRLYNGQGKGYSW